MISLLHTAAALAGIAGCLSFRAWRQVRRSALWLPPGTLSLLAFMWLLAPAPADAAGRAFAADGGISIAASLAWPGVAEGIRPDRRDVAGAAVNLAGASVIPFAPRGA